MGDGDSYYVSATVDTVIQVTKMMMMMMIMIIQKQRMRVYISRVDMNPFTVF